MPREALPNRRQSENMLLRHEGHEFKITIGFYDDGRPGDVFAEAAKSGTAMSHILADACVIISLALQYGVAPGALMKSLGRVPDLDKGKGAERPASVLGEILAVMAEARQPALPKAVWGQRADGMSVARWAGGDDGV